MLKFDLQIDLKDLENYADTRFGLNTPFQQHLEESVFMRALKYMPKDTGVSESTAIALNSARFGDGELIYQPPYGWLWDGLSPSGRPITYTLTRNPKAGARWIYRMWEAENTVVLAELQRLIDSGRV